MNKPCPFCGRAVQIKFHVWRTKATVIHDPQYVTSGYRCILDQLSYDAFSASDAKRIWNTRFPKEEKDSEADAEL